MIMYKTLSILVLGSLLAGGVMAQYDPPRMIGQLYGVYQAEVYFVFGKDFVCVGDQNGDGYDDLLINNGTWNGGFDDDEYPNRVELYYGGEVMDSIADFVIAGPPCGPIMVGQSIQFLGRITGSENPYWAISYSHHDYDPDRNPFI